MARTRPGRSRGCAAARWLLVGLLALGVMGCGDIGGAGSGHAHGRRAERHKKRRHHAPHLRMTARSASRPPRERNDTGGTHATVSRVIDGDTIAVVAGGAERDVRIIGIDTPETHRPGTPIECGGPGASAHIERLVAPGQRVRLTVDPTQDRVDRYHRLLRYVSVDGADVGLAQVRSGWAETYVYGATPFRRVARYRSAAAGARRAQRGVWGACGGDFHSARRASDGSAPPRRRAVSSSAGNRCDPNYRGACLKPDSADYDCRGGEGDGPDYTGPVRVVGADHYGLDTDGDGTACEDD